MSDILLRVRGVQHRTGLGRSKIYMMIGEGRFPNPLKIDGCSLWPASEIDQWIETLKATAPRIDSSVVVAGGSDARQ